MEKSIITFEELVKKLKEKRKPNKDHLLKILGNENNFHYFSYYDQSGEVCNYFLVYTKNGIAYFPVDDVFYGNGWQRIEIEKAKMMNEKHVVFLKDGKKSLEEDINALSNFHKDKKATTCILDMELDDFIDELTDYKYLSEEDLSRLVSKNNKDNLVLYVKSALPDEKYLGYIFVQLEKGIIMIPYYSVFEKAGWEQLDIGGIRFFKESDKKYLENVLKNLEESINIMELVLEKQKLRQIFK